MVERHYGEDGDARLLAERGGGGEPGDQGGGVRGGADRRRPPGQQHQQAGEAVRPAHQPGHRLAVYRLQREERPGQQGGGAGEVEAVAGGGVEQHHSHGVDGQVGQVEHRSAQPEHTHRPPAEKSFSFVLYVSRNIKL